MGRRAADDQCIWPDGGDGLCDHKRGIVRLGDATDRKADMEHTGVCAGWGFETGGRFLEPDCLLDTTARPPASLVEELLKHLENRADTSAWRRNLSRYPE